MTREDYNYAKSIYDKMFWMQVFKPEEMKQAYRCLFGQEPANTQQARARVAAYFRYNVTPVFSDEVDKTETAIPSDSTSLSTPESTELSTHTEDESFTEPTTDCVVTKPKSTELSTHTEDESFTEPTNLKLVTKPKRKSNGRRKKSTS